ncbi:MAG: PIN domain-containing protein [Tepidisphaeraceae bacterium]
MSERRYLDTNVIIRHLTQDDARLAKVADRLFAACDRAELMLVILPVVLAECVFLLESFYKKSRSDIAVALSTLVGSPGIVVVDANIHVDALARYGRGKVHFVDCLIAAHAAATGHAVASFDADMKKFSDVRVELQ